MSNIMEFIGALAMLGGIGTAIYWGASLMRHRHSKHTGWTAIILVVVGFFLVGTNSTQSSSSSPKHDGAYKAALVSKASQTAHRQSTVNHATDHSASSKTPGTKSNHGTILTQLTRYTNQESGGPNGDYYYKVGHARLSNFSGLRAGDAHFASDQQGRPTTAKAVLTYSDYSNSRGSRQGAPLQPVGWPNSNPKVAISYKLTGRTYHGYLYNRSHSIGDSLLGAKSYTSANNFTTGTRPQNVGADQDGGMRYAEETVENYWQSHPNSKQTVDYQTTPVYKGNEQIPRGSIVDIKSSDGAINTEIVVINAAEGIKVDYNNGDSDAKPVTTSTKHSAVATTATVQHHATTTTHQTRRVSKTAAATTTGKWHVAASGMVYVSDSHKYYAKVTNPANYQYESETQAQAGGASRATRGNQYARPY